MILPARLRSLLPNFPAAEAECTKPEVTSLESSEVEILEGADAIVRAAPAWKHITAHFGVPTPFQSLEVANAVASTHVKQGDILRVIVVRRAGETVLVMPTIVASWLGLSVVQFLGDPLIQYGDILSTSNATAEDYRAAISAATDPRVGCFVLLRKVRDDAKITKFLRQIMHETLVQESPLIELQKPSVLSARDRRELRRLRRRLVDQGTVEVRFVEGAAASELVRDVLRFKRAWINAKGFASLVIGNPHWEDAIYKLCQDNKHTPKLVVAALTVGDRIAALEVAFVDDTCWYAFLGAFSPDFAHTGPGRILTDQCITHARAAQLSIYDQLPPSQPYKREQATNSISVRDYARVLTPLGYLVLMMCKIRSAVKLFFSVIPARISNPILSWLHDRKN